MEMISVQSSNILAIGYDPKIRALEVEFRSGSVYQYSGVPQDVYTALMQAESKGSYLHVNVKGKYPFRQVR